MKKKIINKIGQCKPPPLRELSALTKGMIEENIKLKKAIKDTLAENGHLADGDNCTLIKLKNALK